MKHLSTLFLLTWIWLSANAQWQTLPDVAGLYVSKCSFPSAEVGYVVGVYSFTGFSALWKTADGGQTWQELFVQGPSNELLLDVHFISESDGYLLLRQNTDNELVLHVLRTTNGGQDWEDVSPPIGDPGFGNGAVRGLTGGVVVAGSGTHIYTSNDAGETWDTSETEEYQTPMAIDLPDADHIAIGMADGTFAYKGLIYSSTDGGQTWSKYEIDDEYSQIVRVLAPDTQTILGLSVGPVWMPEPGFHPWLHRSTDFGATWEQIDLTLLSEARASDMAFVNDTLYVSSMSSPGIISAPYPGLNFSNEFDPGYAITCLCKTADNDLYAFGMNGEAFRKVASPSSVFSLPNQAPLLYPNPARQSVRFVHSRPVESIVVTDIHGRELSAFRPGASDGLIDVSGFGSGLYFIKMTDAEGMTIHRVVVE